MSDYPNTAPPSYSEAAGIDSIRLETDDNIHRNDGQVADISGGAGDGIRHEGSYPTDSPPITTQPPGIEEMYHETEDETKRNKDDCDGCCDCDWAECIGDCDCSGDCDCDCDFD